MMGRAAFSFRVMYRRTWRIIILLEESIANIATRYFRPS